MKLILNDFDISWTEKNFKFLKFLKIHEGKPFEVRIYTN